MNLIFMNHDDAKTSTGEANIFILFRKSFIMSKIRSRTTRSSHAVHGMTAKFIRISLSRSILVDRIQIAFRIHTTMMIHLVRILWRQQILRIVGDMGVMIRVGHGVGMLRQVVLDGPVLGRNGGGASVGVSNGVGLLLLLLLG